ncbi:MAG: YigZ family protein [Bacilli bacterium]|nr:YigZ family protein [Bacilli bacterium]
MKTIKENISNELVIKNSKFITLLYKLNTNNIDNIMSEVKELYPKATHYCYAYIYNNYKKSSDDGEPTGTAGAPIMNVLEKEQLNNILVVVVRYFGGIKLGAGGLIRAYTKAVTEALKQALYQELISGYKVQIDFDYSQEKQLNYLLNDSIIIEKKYDEKITYLALIDKQVLDKLHGYDYQILEELYIEKSINC